MTEWLLRTFVKGYAGDEGAEEGIQVEDPAVRRSCGTFAAVLGILCNTLLCAAKMVVGFLAGSLSIVADAVHNLADAASNIISLLGFKLAAKPADTDHPYGHGRYEYLSSLLVSALILVLGVELLKTSVEKILNPEPVEFNWGLVVVLAVAIVIILAVSVFDQKVGKAIKSQALIATGIDARNDVLATAAVLVATLISHFTALELDAWMGAVVALVIVWSGITLVKETLNTLLGGPPEQELVDMIEAKVMGYEGILGIHDLIVHDYGPGRLFASLHAEVAAEVPVLESHDLIDRIEGDFRFNDNMEVVIHLDPIVTDDPRVAELRAWVSGLVKEIDPSLSIHDFRMVPGESHTNLIFDCVLPYSVDMTEEELRKTIGEKVWETYPNYFCVVQVDRSYVLQGA